MIKRKLFGTLPTKEEIQSRYSAQKNHSGYQELLASATRVLGVWDDHDFGINDGDRTSPMKDTIKDIFLDFVDEPVSSSRRGDGKGMQASYKLTEGVKLILLDGRYNYDRESGDFLGEEQWAWLAQELNDPSARVILIGSGVQVVDWRKRGIAEGFSNYPQTRKRLFQTIEEANQGNAAVLFLSGDVHHAELSRTHTCTSKEVQSNSGEQTEWKVYPWHDFTSSGLTHSWDNLHGRMLSFPVWVQQLYKNFLSRFVVMSAVGQPVDGVGEPFLGLNFAVIDFYLQSDQPYLHLQVQSEAGVVREFDLLLSSLRPHTVVTGRGGAENLPAPVQECTAEVIRAIKGKADRSTTFKLVLTSFAAFVALAIVALRARGSQGVKGKKD